MNGNAKRTKSLYLAAGLWLLCWVDAAQAGPGPGIGSGMAKSARAVSACAGPAVALPRVCGVALAAPKVSCTEPGAVEGNLRQQNLNVVQRASNIFSWQLLIGLHWPALAGQRGVPDPAQTLASTAPRVWETWKEASEVFRHDANGEPLPPTDWDDPPPPPPPACGGVGRVLFRTSKIADVLDAAAQPTGADARFQPPTLTGRDGGLVRYEIRMNRVAFAAITDARHQWWDARRQNQLDSVTFPEGSRLVKAAWVPLDQPGPRFATIQACVCDAADAAANCSVQPMGLVGFHVMSKVAGAPQWLWSTFEHKDNVGLGPTNFLPPPAACPQCANRQRPQGQPNRVARTTPIPAVDPDCTRPDLAVDNVQALNGRLQAALAGTPLAHYELVNTQWPLPTAGTNPHTVFRVLPPLLANTTLETFIQPTSSCMGCHAMARTQRPHKFVSADFSFTLNDAYPVLKNTRILPAPLCDPRQAVADPVCIGARVANHTYEELPANARAQLHCGSCHLDGGRNPDAAWWVGAVDYWNQNLKTGGTGIAGRINSCFKNSLNGAALCWPDANGACPQNAAMTALIAYMKWIDAEAQRQQVPPGTSGFPPIPAGVGSIGNGNRTFAQKCAFCHNAGGEGRYAGGVYYRPALWGPKSFNAQAGMDSTADLAPFIHANMPLHSGGVLTVQEAWDLACFIDAQPRPAGVGAHPPTSNSPPLPLCRPD